MASGKGPHSQRLRAAAGWYAELQAPDLDPETFEAFQAWEADPANARAFAEIDRSLVTMDRTSLDREAAEGRRDRARVAWQDWRLGLAGLAAGLLLAILAFAAWPVAPLEAPVVYTTGLGEIREVGLEDGSLVTLNTDTRIGVSFAADERLVEIVAGEAVFDVVKDDRRFVVEAGASRTEALGTRFGVRALADDVAVILVEGSVRVQVGQGDGTVLLPGEQLVMSRGGDVRVNGVDAERLLSWEEGLVAFDNATLAEAVAEMNRYSDVALVIGDEALASERVSGRFPAGEQAAFAESLELFLPVEAEVSAGRIVLQCTARHDWAPLQENSLTGRDGLINCATQGFR